MIYQYCDDSYKMKNSYSKTKFLQIKGCTCNMYRYSIQYNQPTTNRVLEHSSASTYTFDSEVIQLNSLLCFCFTFKHYSASKLCY